jgi:hypothetical protein
VAAPVNPGAALHPEILTLTSPRPAGTRFFLSCSAVIVCLIVPACGESGSTLPMGKVSGKVTYEGKPLTSGTVSFVSTESGRPNANGTISSDGTYNLHTQNFGDGAALGDYNVMISSVDPKEYNTKLPGTAPREKKIKSTVPKKYDDPKTSGLKETVKSGTNTFNFDLK